MDYQIKLFIEQKNVLNEHFVDYVLLPVFFIFK